MPLTTVEMWARGRGLEIVLLVTGAILLGRLTAWLGAKITDRIDGAARRLTHDQSATVAGQAAVGPLGRAHQVRDADASATPHGAAVFDGNAIPGQRPGHIHPGGDASSVRHRLCGSDSGDIAFLLPPAPPSENIAAWKKAMRRMFR